MNPIVISFCITSYNSGDTVDQFMKSFLNFRLPYEMIIVDNFSTDSTYENFKKYENDKIHIFQEKCTRGRGRQIGIEKSKGEYICIVDVDVFYMDLENTIENILKNYSNDFVLCSGKDKGSLMSFFPSDFIREIGGYPDLNYGEDVYVWNIAMALGRFVKIPEDERFAKNIPRDVSKKDISTERRYERNLIRLVIRRILITRDILFVFNLNLDGLMKFYRTGENGKKKMETLFFYIAGKMIQFSIRIPKAEEKARMIAESYHKSRKIP